MVTKLILNTKVEVHTKVLYVCKLWLFIKKSHITENVNLDVVLKGENDDRLLNAYKYKNTVDCWVCQLLWFIQLILNGNSKLNPKGAKPKMPYMQMA